MVLNLPTEHAIQQKYGFSSHNQPMNVHPQYILLIIPYG
jgi:hypothetical protein